ncbi:hypothetical protein TWF481_008971 [Arthrobotrys musiformis]|uniref:Uncharacterized protein n=1 Tax=Arthrobotrys musiformis TaxID=47236 RepID=A0AAV9W286_9PEZI
MPPAFSALLYSEKLKGSIFPSYIDSFPYLQTATPHDNLENFKIYHNNFIQQENHVYPLTRRDSTRDVPVGEYWMWRVLLMGMFAWVFCAMCAGSYILGKKRRREEENEKVEMMGLNTKHRLRGFGHPVPYRPQEIYKHDRAYQRYRRKLMNRLRTSRGEWLRKRIEAKKNAAHKNALKKALEREIKRKEEKAKRFKPLSTPIPWDNYDDPPDAAMGNDRDEFDTRIPMPRDRRRSTIDKARRQSILIQQEDQIRNMRKRSSVGILKPDVSLDGVEGGLESQTKRKGRPEIKDPESSLWLDANDKIPAPWQWIIETDPWLRNLLRKAEITNGLYHYTAPPSYPPPGFLEEIIERETGVPNKENKKPPPKAQAVPWGEMRGRHAYMPDLPTFEEYEHPWDEYAGNIDFVMRPLNLREHLWVNEATRLQRGRLLFYDDQWKQVAERKGYGSLITTTSKGATRTSRHRAQEPSRPMKRGPGGLFLPTSVRSRK